MGTGNEGDVILRIAGSGFPGLPPLLCCSGPVGLAYGRWYACAKVTDVSEANRSTTTPPLRDQNKAIAGSMMDVLIARPVSARLISVAPLGRETMTIHAAVDVPDTCCMIRVIRVVDASRTAADAADRAARRAAVARVEYSFSTWLGFTRQQPGSDQIHERAGSRPRIRLCQS